MNSKYQIFTEEVLKPWLKEHVTEGYTESEDGISLHYCTAIHPQEKAAIVMVHGFCEFFGKYHETAYRFFREGFSVFFLELRGHGHSERTRAFADQRVTVDSFDEYVSDIDAFVRNVVQPQSLSGKLFLYAHSMGGCAGALFLENCRDIFQCAVLSSPMLKVDYGGIPEPAVDALAVATQIGSIGDRFAPGQHEWRGEDLFLSSSCMDRDRYEYQFNQRMEDEHYQTWGGTWAWAAAAKKGTDEAVRNADRITVPVLICQSGNDGMVDNEGQIAFRNNCLKSYLISFEGAEHELFNADSFTREKYYHSVLTFYQIMVSLV